MTAVVYDGKILAVDSRTTHSTSSDDHVCTSCGEPTEVVSEKAEKLHLSNDMTFRGRKVIAAAGAGAVAAISELISMLKKDVDMEMAFKHFRMFARSSEVSATILLVTEDAVFTINGRSVKELAVKQFKRDEFVAIGSGADAAETAHRLLGIDAISAINVAAGVDKGTGGRIHWVRCDEPMPKKANVSMPEDPKQLIEKYRVGRVSIPVPLVRTEPFVIKAASGREIEGVLTMTAGTPAASHLTTSKKTPAVKLKARKATK